VGRGEGRPRAGMSYQIQVAPAAVRQLRKLDPSARRRVQAAIELLAENPRPVGARKLVGGQGEWRVRTGDYRVVYEVHDQILLVLVLAVGHRREIYRPR
jgi:mRNA interferase RelE/StbE